MLLPRFQACMVLSAVGDAMGYKNGDWEFNTSSKIIHEQMLQITSQKGPNDLKIDMSWRYSDDTVMHIATAEALLKSDQKILLKEEGLPLIGKNLGKYYKASGNRMAGRAPGKTCMRSMKIL
jgi:ADP-ribosylarginine hydrolase